MKRSEQVSGPAGWRRTTLGEALPIRYGKARSEGHGIVREQTPVYGSSGVIDTFQRSLTSGPTLIIGRKGTIGATYYCPEPCWPIDTVFFAEAIPENDLRFFKYLLDHLQLGQMDRSTAVPGLSRDDYNATEIFLPQFDYQQRIVAEIEKQFSRLDEAVASLKRTKANLKRYKASVLKSAVEGKLTEEWRKQHPDVEPAAKLLERILAERRAKWSGKGKYKEPVALDTSDLPTLPGKWAWAVVDQLGVVQLGRQRSPKNRSKDHPVQYIRAANITESGLDLSDLLDMEFSPQEQERYRLRSGDLVLSEASGSPNQVGKPAVWRNQLSLCCFQNTVIRLRPSVDLSPYLLTCFKSYYINGVFAKVAGGVGINHLSADKFSRVAVPLSPVAEQEQIVSEVERRLSVIEELEAAVEANLARADRLRQAILALAFAGKLVNTAMKKALDSSHDFPIAAESPSTYRAARQDRRSR